jgi:hypothetical protein
MLSIAYRKSFEVKTQFECHITYKSNHVLLNSMKLHRRCFSFYTSYMTKCSKLVQNFTIAFTYDIMIYY